MALGKQGDRNGKMFVAWDEIPKSPGHVFYDRLQGMLAKAGFDRFVEELCVPFYASHKGRPSIPPGRYFRMHLVGYFEGIDSERGIEWRCADSLSLREFLLLDMGQAVPDHSSLSRIRSRLSLELHQEVFTWVLNVITQAGLVQGDRIGVDASTMEANAAMRSIVRKDTGEGYRQMLQRMAKESGMKTPTNEDLSRMDRQRKGKKTSNTDWESPTDPEARVARMKDGRTRLAYKPEHAVDLDTGALIAVDIHPADQGDTKTLGETLKTTKANLEKVGKAPSPDNPTELIADKGYHSRAVLKALDYSPWKTRIAEPKRKGLNWWNGDHDARRAVYNNRIRLGSGKASESAKRRTELAERSFQHTLDRGGMRKTWLRGRENVEKRYLLHVAGFNLGLLMRKMTGYGTPKGAADAWNLAFVGFWTKSGWILLVFAAYEEQPGEFTLLAAISKPLG